VLAGVAQPRLTLKVIPRFEVAEHPDGRRAVALTLRAGVAVRTRVPDCRAIAGVTLWALAGAFGPPPLDGLGKEIEQVRHRRAARRVPSSVLRRRNLGSRLRRRGDANHANGPRLEFVEDEARRGCCLSPWHTPTRNIKKNDYGVPVWECLMLFQRMTGQRNTVVSRSKTITTTRWTSLNPSFSDRNVAQAKSEVNFS